VVKLAISLSLLIAIFQSAEPGNSFPSQRKAAPTPAVSSACDRQNAFDIVQQQIIETKTFDDSVQRITVLIRAADLLWVHVQKDARAAFREAFELAKQDFKSKGNEPKREGVGLTIDVPDQRYRVLSAIAKRDLGWARELTDQMLRDQRADAEEKAVKDQGVDLKTAENLLQVAFDFVPSDQSAALAYAHSSLRYPATFYLPLFMFKLAESNQAAANDFYRHAHDAYANAPIDRFLYLSSYPFGNNQEAGEMPGYTIYRVPAGFIPSPPLQRLFVQTLLRRVREYLERPLESPPAQSGRVPEPAQMWLALTRLGKQIEESLPELASSLEPTKADLFARLSQSSQGQMGHIINRDNPIKPSFDEQVQSATKNPNVDRRDQALVSAITVAAAADENLEKILRIADQISDAGTRRQLLNWLYFTHTQAAIKAKQLDEARKMALNVDEFDQRSYLYSQIAEESLKDTVDQTQARELLEEVVNAAARAPATVVTARSLLAVAYLYTKVDALRAMVVLGEAVKTINRLERPDFSTQFVMRRIEGKTFGSYASFQTPGFRPENVFRELGKLDFEGTLYQASQFSNKSLRALTILALVEPCLAELPPSPPKAKKTKKG